MEREGAARRAGMLHPCRGQCAAAQRGPAVGTGLGTAPSGSHGLLGERGAPILGLLLLFWPQNECLELGSAAGLAVPPHHPREVLRAAQRAPGHGEMLLLCHPELCANPGQTCEVIPLVHQPPLTLFPGKNTSFRSRAPSRPDLCVQGDDDAHRSAVILQGDQESHQGWSPETGTHKGDGWDSCS